LARSGVRGTFSQPGPSHPTVGVRLARTLGLAAHSQRSPLPLESIVDGPAKNPETELMTVLFFAVAIVVGALCGALMG
jgi:hypothetical protein